VQVVDEKKSMTLVEKKEREERDEQGKKKKRKRSRILCKEKRHGRRNIFT